MSKQQEAFDEQVETTKVLIRDYNDNLTVFKEEIDNLFLINDVSWSTLNNLKAGLNDLKKDYLKPLNSFLDAISTSYAIENEMFREIVTEEGEEKCLTLVK